MQLRWSPTSPYVRKVVVMMKEKGIEDAVERIKSNPLSRDDREASPNPLGKIPCLITNDGLALWDSPVILEYLDEAFDGPEMLPKSGPARWIALRRQATADGMLEASVACFVEGLRKPERQSAGWIAHNKGIAFKGIDALDGEAGGFGDAIDIGTISAAVAVSFVGQTFPDEDWRPDHPDLAAWFERFDARPSMRETVLIPANEFK